jgi:hypothetical protein
MDVHTSIDDPFPPEHAAVMAAFSCVPAWRVVTVSAFVTTG